MAVIGSQPIGNVEVKASALRDLPHTRSPARARTWGSFKADLLHLNMINYLAAISCHFSDIPAHGSSIGRGGAKQ